MQRFSSLLLILCVFACFAGAQETLTNDSILKMVKAGVGEDVIIGMINSQAGKYSTGVDDVIALKAAGVPDKVISAMMAKASAGPAKPAAETAKPEAQPAPSGIARFLPTRFEKVHYLMKLPGENKAKEVEGSLVFDGAEKSVRFVAEDDPASFQIRYPSITGMLYERAAKPRYGLGLLVAWPLLFTKSKKHFLTFQYQTEGGAGEFAIVRLDKSNFQMCLATAEAQVGRKIERTEER
jgi:hypothetical protein